MRRPSSVAVPLPLLDAVVAAQAGRVIGVEREYSVHDDSGGAVDCGGCGLAHRTGSRPRSRRRSGPPGPWGGVVTADGQEAEVATPPVKAVPGSSHRVLALVAAGEAHLRSALPSGLRLDGYSTHINIEVDDRRVAKVAHLIAHRLAVALMLGIDRRDSPGLLVRPRYGRLEIGGEFATGDQLRAAIAISTSVVLMAEQAVGDRTVRRALPAPSDVRVERARERFGWYVDRTVFGGDLYSTGRGTLLRRGRCSIPAGELLAETWAATRPYGEPVLGADELELVHRLVDGRAPLPSRIPPRTTVRSPPSSSIVATDHASAQSGSPSTSPRRRG